MDSKTLPIVIGGLLPAVLFGFSGVCQKFSARAGIATGPYLVVIGATIFVMGIVFTAVEKNTQINLRSAATTALFAFFWASSTACIAIALRRYNAQLSTLVPLYNMNTLVAVLISLVVFAEWQSINVPKILLASVIIIIGGVLAATA